MPSACGGAPELTGRVTDSEPADAEHGPDNPVYSSLTGFHSGIAEVCGRARRFPVDVAPFLGLPAAPDEQDWLDAADLVGGRGAAALVRQDLDVPHHWAVLQTIGVVQMTARKVSAGPDPEAAPLGQDDVPDMLRLTAETKPGPFLARTIELGSYVGIRRGGELIAMAGERFRAPGWTEISAVCTAAGHRGEGLASRLIRTVLAGIEARGDRAFLHAEASNDNAIRLYESLGFVPARGLTVTVVRPRAGRRAV